LVPERAEEVVAQVPATDAGGDLHPAQPRDGDQFGELAPGQHRILQRHAPTALTRPGWAAAAAASASFCIWQIRRASRRSASTGTRLIQGESSRWPTPVAADSVSMAATSVNSPVTELISRPRKPSR